MNSITITKAIVCNGFNGEPAIRFSTTADGTKTCQFKVGEEVYDSRLESKKRYNNWRVRAYGSVAERIEKMKLAPMGRINLIGRLDIYTFTDENEKRHEQLYIVINELEYASPPKEKSEGTENSDETTENTETTEETVVEDALSDCKVIDLDKESPFSSGSLFGI